MCQATRVLLETPACNNQIWAKNGAQGACLDHLMIKIHRWNHQSTPDANIFPVAPWTPFGVISDVAGKMSRATGTGKRKKQKTYGTNAFEERKLLVLTYGHRSIASSEFANCPACCQTLVVRVNVSNDPEGTRNPRMQKPNLHQTYAQGTCPNHSLTERDCRQSLKHRRR